MAEELETERSDVREDGRRPPRAVVGSHRVEEEMFGKAFDGNIVKRIWAFVHPYRRQVLLSVRRCSDVHGHAAADPADHPLCDRPRHAAGWKPVQR